MTATVSMQVTTVSKPFATDVANEWPAVFMDTGMFGEITASVECFVTIFTRKWLDTNVNPIVIKELQINIEQIMNINLSYIFKNFKRTHMPRHLA